MQSVGQHWIWHESGVPCHGVSGQNPGTQKESTPMNIKNVAVALVALIASSAAYGAYGQSQAVQWRVSDGGNGHWYRLDAPYFNRWTDAQQHATGIGGHLMTLTSEAEQAFAANLAFSTTPNSVDDCWLGGFQDRSAPDYSEPAGGWKWVTGEPWNFASWRPGQPTNVLGNNDFLVATTVPSDQLRWVDSTVWHEPGNCQAFVEWSADCNGDGIVDYGQCRDGSLPDYDGNNVPDCCESGTPCVVGSYPVQWRVEDGGNGHWYRGVLLSSAGISWTDARLAAQQARADLASLDNQALADWIWTSIASRPELWGPHIGPWVGGFQPSGSPEPAGGWVWVNGQPVGDSIVWAPGQPDNYVPCGGPNDFMSYFKNFQPLPRNEFSDNSNQAVTNCPGGSLGPTTSAIFEWSADCNNDGVVDYGQILQGQLVDADANGIPDVCEVDPCPGDITGGGFVDAIDLSILLAFWGSTGGGEFDADVNNDGIVEGADLSIVLSGWGPCPN